MRWAWSRVHSTVLPYTSSASSSPHPLAHHVQIRYDLNPDAVTVYPGATPPR